MTQRWKATKLPDTFLESDVSDTNEDNFDEEIDSDGFPKFLQKLRETADAPKLRNQAVKRKEFLVTEEMILCPHGVTTHSQYYPD